MWATSRRRHEMLAKTRTQYVCAMCRISETVVITSSLALEILVLRRIVQERSKYFLNSQLGSPASTLALLRYVFWPYYELVYIAENPQQLSLFTPSLKYDSRDPSPNHHFPGGSDDRSD